jgi:glycine dehydrogenase
MSSRPFSERHIGPSPEQQAQILTELGLSSLEDLASKTVPASIRMKGALQIPAGIGENEFLAELKALASENKTLKNCIGMGYFGTFMPPAIQRNILENPGWYTAYTPYQAEISQGRLEMLFHFQTMISELSGFPIAGASLLDEATAAAEVMAMFHAFRKAERKEATTFGIVGKVYPQTAAVIKTRAKWLGIEVREFVCIKDMPTDVAGLFGIIVQNPDGQGKARDLSESVARLQSAGVQVVIAADLLASTILKSPGSMGADAAIGSTQRFGLPLGNGGPHAGFLATKDSYKRLLPGRIIGLSKDAQGKPAYRMALGTREQHIRREKATSNICTSQVLPAVLATAYAIYHGPAGLKQIATRVNGLAQDLASALKAAGAQVRHDAFFDTLKVSATPALFEAAVAKGYNLRRLEDGDAGISLDETTTPEDVATLASLWNGKPVTTSSGLGITGTLVRNDGFLAYPAFLDNQSEHALLRYLKRLENKDISLTHSMIPLGSCTMKLNAAAEMIPLSWPELANIHPFAPKNQKAGYAKLIVTLENWLAECTKFAGVSLMPNSGAQGEYAGIVVIRSYQESIGQGHRNVALIPASAHGTNPASAALAGLTCVTVKCDEKGNIDVADLRLRAEEYKDSAAVLMVTYPSTHGVFEETIIDVCNIIHEIGAQVYMDGANMNAQVGLTAPGIIGADVCHLNLHKTFAIPHGGGGPGSGPIGVAKHLVPFLPKHPVTDGDGQNAVSAGPWGSALILAISYGYIRMMGGDGLKQATLGAILNANYLRHKLSAHYPILYTGTHGFCAHEFIVDCRGFKKATGIEAGDIAKRLMDYGFHAPTVSFPVANTLMIEPTESEPLAELDRFAEAMIAIRKEIAAIEDGTADKEDNMLHHAPHTLDELLGEWKHAYSREEAAFPLAWLRAGKPWPSVSRIDNAFGDRNLICSCGQISG